MNKELTEKRQLVEKIGPQHWFHGYWRATNQHGKCALHPSSCIGVSNTDSTKRVISLTSGLLFISQQNGDYLEAFDPATVLELYKYIDELEQTITFYKNEMQEVNTLLERKINSELTDKFIICNQ